MASMNINKEVENFHKFYAENYKTLETALDYFRSLITSLLLDNVSVHRVSSRVKERDECVNKFRKKYQKDLENSSTEYEIRKHITDLLGLRVVCLYEPDITLVKELINKELDIIHTTDKISEIDSTENQFGYKCLHLDVKLDLKRKNLPENKHYKDFQFEVQIRSIIQDSWSVLDHKIKYKKSIPLELKRRINRLAAIFELADDEFYNVKVDTENYEKEIHTEAVKPQNVLNIFNFIDVVNSIFPTYQFISYKVDDFLHDILENHAELTFKQFKKALEDNIEIIRNYNSHLISESMWNNLNPYTMIRHCLYLNDKKKMSNILYDIQKKNIDKWIEEGKK